MKYFIHLDANPVPKKVGDPTKAVKMAYDFLTAGGQLPVKWIRRRESWPYTYCEYDEGQMAKELSASGRVLLQRAEIGADSLPAAGTIVTILSEDLERKRTEEAKAALSLASQKV